MNTIAISRRALLAAPALLSVGAALGQDNFPNRPLRLLVPFAPGGVTDLLTRLVAPAASGVLGQPIVVENRPGGTGAIAMEAVARATPDGYTAMVTGASWPVVILLNPKLPFRMSDFAPLARLTVAPHVFAVPASLPVQSVAEFVTEAKKRPGEWSYGTSGVGTTLHLASEMLKLRTGIDLVHVPYRGNLPALTDLLAGRIQTMFPTLAETITYIREGRLRALAVGHDERVDWLPDVPTMTEVGYGDIPASSHLGVACGAAVPESIRSKLSEAFRVAIGDAQVAERLRGLGVIPATRDADQYASMVSAESARFSEVIRAANITLN
jgi:tripartite-type tricarboxylate transporter receptor subunit TctC